MSTKNWNYFGNLCFSSVNSTNFASFWENFAKFWIWQDEKRKKKENPDDKLMAIKQLYLKYRNHIVPWFCCGVQGLRWTQGTDFDLPIVHRKPSQVPFLFQGLPQYYNARRRSRRRSGSSFFFLDYRNPKP